MGERGFQLCGGAGGIEPCGRIRLQEQCVFRQLARVGAPAPGREHALVDRDEAPERAQTVQVLAAARKPVEDAGRVRGEAVALEDVERFCGGVHGMDGHDAARARLRGAGGHDAVEGAELRRARRCMGAREVEPDFAHKFVGGGLGGRPRSRLLAGRARLDAPGMEPGSDTHVGCRGEALARCRVLGRCERGVEQGDTALPYGGCDFWAVRHVAQVAVRVDEAIAPAGGASSPEGFAFPRTSDGAPARLARSGPHALPPLRPASLPCCAASCMASAALVSSSAPTPESYRRTSPASICPIMGASSSRCPDRCARCAPRRVRPRCARAPRRSTGHADGGCRDDGTPCA